MKKKLIIYNVIMAFVVLFLSLLTGMLVTTSNYTDISEQRIKQITAIYVSNYSEDMTLVDDADVRITLIDPQGNVIKDSSATEISENHLGREEIIAAKNGAPAVVKRYSSTTKKDMIYYAEAITENGEIVAYVRVAIHAQSVDSFVLKSLAPMILILLVVWLCSVVASVLLSGVVLKPLKQVKNGLNTICDGTYKKVVPATGDEDMNAILGGINDVSEKLQSMIVTAEEQKQRLNYVLANVTDGIAVFDENLNIVIANDALKEIFGITEPEGKRADALTADRTFISAIEDCADKTADVIFTLENDGRYYQCTARHTDSNLVIAVLCDVTENKQSEKVRLEFFANASHELKTPLTAVKGFNDMIAMQSGEEATLAYSGRIDKEVNRLIQLLNDMLDLSKLENSRPDVSSLVPADLKEISLEIKEELAPVCKEKNVTIAVEGEGSVPAEREHMYELIKNLAENGVRYNNDGGHVSIKITSVGAETSVTVSDDGIGIDASQQTRIFERFYRVNKSRSRATGGTGLGLAIVKHICRLYDAELTLKSGLSLGTTITITFR